jgi:phosphoribosylformylglycinamidine synthase
MVKNLGFNIETDDSIRKDAFLFGEAQGRIVVSIRPEQQEAFVEYMSLNNIDYSYLGDVTSSEILIDNESYGEVAEYKHRYEHAIEEIIEKQ